ncbi:MAG: hypothetical protein CO164_03255 [Rhodocyclales bacterium CG_4_9_14_3_um_filter_68_10]|nr:MAG: hypothetical protein COZ38_10860 [Rhodocyclales bacterium CG_4_10_14_3_um_filter_68_10]PJA58335.1 MAG: hypothetical protein CO164_03255 [Rhodocyclales bacterium CG_4_9_14_3_um_filter_68_10]
MADVRAERGKWASFVLSAATHALLVVVLIYGVRWQSHPPEAVEVELVRDLPAPAPVPERAKAEPRPLPPREVKPQPRPAPRPDIALREKPEKPKPRPEPKKEVPAPRPEPKKEVPAPRPNPELQRSLIDEQIRNETERLAQARAADEAAHQAKAVRERQADSARESARARAAAEYIDRVRAKIRGNIVLPADVRGNPEAVFEVSQLPNGEVLPPLRLKRSSGHAGLDLAIERAILKSSPLPRPPSPELFSRVLELRFRPLEDGEGR